VIFRCLVTVFVLTPLIFAVGALAIESQAVLPQIAAADKTGMALPSWLEYLPVVGAWLARRWQSEFACLGALSVCVQHVDAAAILHGAQLLGQMMTQQALIHRIHDPGAVFPLWRR
jgi:hypothetical protein